MPTTLSDEDLLDAFVKSQDDKAFRSLVERYSGLILHTALRTLNDRALAEDVAQRVLGVLAKKAAQVTQGNAPLPAWLHRTTILEAKSIRRSESRHHRKKEALMRAPADPPQSGESAWKEALPHLDDAIDSLPEADRHVILLHYVNEMTFPEIARQVGKSAAAVQKQSRRALDTLQRILGRRGVSLSLGILTTGLATEMAKAAPALLIPSLATISSLTQTTTSVLVVKKTTLIAIGVTVLLCGVPLARQQVTISRLEAKSSAASGATPELRRSSRATATTSVSLVERLTRDLKAQDRDVPRYLGAVDYIEELRDEEFISLIKQAVASSMPINDQLLLLGTLFDKLANKDRETGRFTNPELVLHALVDHLTPEMIGKLQQSHSTLTEYLRSFSEKDSSKALAWFHEHLNQIRTIPAERGVPKDRLEQEARIGLAYGLIFSNPPEAVTILRPLPLQYIKWELDQLVRSVEPSLRKDASGFIQVTREIFPEKDANDMIAKLHQIQFDHSEGPFNNVDILLGKYEFTPTETEEIIRQFGANYIFQKSTNLVELQKALPQYVDWLATLHPEQTDRRVGEALGKWVISWGRTEVVYEAMLEHRTLGLNDDAVIALLNTKGIVSQFGLEKVETLAGLMTDQELAAQIVDRIKSPPTE